MLSVFWRSASFTAIDAPPIVGTSYSAGYRVFSLGCPLAAQATEGDLVRQGVRRVFWRRTRGNYKNKVAILNGSLTLATAYHSASVACIPCTFRPNLAGFENLPGFFMAYATTRLTHITALSVFLARSQRPRWECGGEAPASRQLRENRVE